MIEDNKKQIVSLRINVSDLGRIRGIARRLRTRDSDVFRFAIKIALAKLAPLHDDHVKGSDLMPVFVECGTELASHFNLDSERLERVINGDLDDANKRVDREDISLLAMSAMPERYLYVKLRELAKRSGEPLGVAELLRDYLNEKYVAGMDPAEDASAES